MNITLFIAFMFLEREQWQQEATIFFKEKYVQDILQNTGHVCVTKRKPKLYTGQVHLSLRTRQSHFAAFALAVFLCSLVFTVSCECSP